MNKYQKVDERTLRVVRDDGVTHDYNYEFLVKQRRSIKAQRARELDMRDEELAEVYDLLKQCAKLGVTELGKAHNIVPLERLGVLPSEPAAASSEVAAPPAKSLIARALAALTWR